MSSSKRIGLLGSGNRLRAVVKNLLAASDGEITVGAVYDPDARAVAVAREAFGEHFATSESAEELVGRKDLDWVFVGSYNNLHATHAIQALRAGKDVFCEKPLATNREDCLAVKQAVEESGRTFFFGLVLRYSPHYQQISRWVSAGKIGQLISFEFNETLDFNHGGHIFNNWRRHRRLSGTHLLEKCCHDLDLANWLVGSLPLKVASFGGRNFFIPENAHHVERIGRNAKGQSAYDTWPGYQAPPFSPGSDVVDNQVAIIEYANHVRATFHTNCNCAITERRFYLCGSEGTLRADLSTGKIELQRIGFDTEIEGLDSLALDGHGGGDEVMARGLRETMLSGAQPLAGVEEGIASCFTAFAINDAMETGRTTGLEEDWARAGIVPTDAGSHPTGSIAWQKPAG
ncbi:MAG: Gfo/Idh/MocA family oxidoreductase [Chthoniobacterales bacterium]|nr:Gfo/Idh/MocA family oxidoreductase [Chthoniobacterales bacterium]